MSPAHGTYQQGTANFLHKSTQQMGSHDCPAVLCAAEMGRRMHADIEQVQVRGVYQAANNWQLTANSTHTRSASTNAQSQRSHHPSHLSCCNAADPLLNPAPQVRLPQIVQSHAPVGTDEGFTQRGGGEGLGDIILHCIATLQLLLDMLCRDSATCVRKQYVATSRGAMGCCQLQLCAVGAKILRLRQLTGWCSWQGGAACSMC